MALFRRKQRSTGRHAAPEQEDARAQEEEQTELSPPQTAEAPAGPFDAAYAPSDDIPRLDLGSVRIPLFSPPQIQIEAASINEVRAVSVIIPEGQVTISAYAAPRSGGLWTELAQEIADNFKAQGATISRRFADWGVELSMKTTELAIHMVGVEGPRWLLRGMIASVPPLQENAPQVLREMMRQTIVDRGVAPLPVRTPLPLVLPPEIAADLANQQAGG